MKSLYESILDDEDVLIGKLKQDINNPFFHIAMLIANKMDYRPLKNELMKWLNKIEMPFDGYWKVTKNFIKFTLDDSNSKKELREIDREVLFISNTPAVHHTYKVPDNAELVVAVIPSDSKFLSKVLKPLKIRSYDDKIDEMARQYDLRLHGIEEKIVKVYTYEKLI